MGPIPSAISRPLFFAVGLGLSVAGLACRQPPNHPNVLFIVVDDLNDWIGHLGRNPQTHTPHLDRLAGWGVSFSNAYSPAPACNPSRVAVMSGMRPSTTGVYYNSDEYRFRVGSDQTLNSYFGAHGYFVAGAGKVFHRGGGRRLEWDDYALESERDWDSVYAQRRFGRLRWGRSRRGEDPSGDRHTVDYCIDQLRQEHRAPFFLACGIAAPHPPWYAPAEYFELHPLAEIDLPPHREDDLSDVPAPGVALAEAGGDHRRILEAGAWQEAVQAYLAVISYADAELGRLLDAFEASPHRGATMIVLWGDHGFHLGEKQHWGKLSLWEEATRTPLIWVAPGVTRAGAISRRTVDLISIYATLSELAGLPIPQHVEGPSLLPLLSDPAAPWDRPAITTHGPGRHAARSEDWRYIRYENGEEELYDARDDPYEWTNLAADPRYEGVKAELAGWLPRQNAPRVETRRHARIR